MEKPQKSEKEMKKENLNCIFDFIYTYVNKGYQMRGNLYKIYFFFKRFLQNLRKNLENYFLYKIFESSIPTT